MVVFSSFMCNIIVDGIIFSFGFLLPEISTEFNENKATTAWIGSLQTGFYLIVGNSCIELNKLHKIALTLKTSLRTLGERLFGDIRLSDNHCSWNFPHCYWLCPLVLC